VRELLDRGPEAVVQHLRRNPPFQACYLMELACCIRDKNRDSFDDNQAEAIQLMVLLLQDMIAREISQCTCFACKPDEGVSLGVVIMRRTTEGRNVACNVYSIDGDDRWRRRLKQQLCQRLLAGDLALLRFLGQSEQTVTKSFETTGVTLERRDGPAGRIVSLDELAEVMDRQTLRFNPLEDRRLGVHVVVDPLGTRRIVAFEPSGGT
jgi:hypothetical protein